MYLLDNINFCVMQMSSQIIFQYSKEKVQGQGEMYAARHIHIYSHDSHCYCRNLSRGEAGIIAR